MFIELCDKCGLGHEEGTCPADERPRDIMRTGEYIARQATKTNDSQEIVRLYKVVKAAKALLEIGKRDMSNPKYDGYFEGLRQALQELHRPRRR